MNGYIASNAWYRFVEGNKRKIKPIHSAVIHWCYAVANENKWANEFQLPTIEACEMIGITDRETFHKALKDLVTFGAIKILQESTGRYVARWVSVNLPDFYRPNFSEGTTVGKPEGNTEGTGEGIPDGSTTNTKDKETKELKNFIKLINADRVDFESVSFESVIEKKQPSPKLAAKGSPKFDPSMVDLPFTGKEFSVAWLAWIKHRQEIKKPLTETAVDQQLKKLSGFDEPTATAIILQTVEKGWQGIVYELRSESKWQPNAPPGKGNIQKNYESVMTAEQRILQKRGLN